jgi:hypothetical protein
MPQERSNGQKTQAMKPETRHFRGKPEANHDETRLLGDATTAELRGRGEGKGDSYAPVRTTDVQRTEKQQGFLNGKRRRGRGGHEKGCLTARFFSLCAVKNQ